MLIPIVDSLAHPTLSGTWMNRPAKADFDSLMGDMQAANMAAACAIGMWGMDGYEHEAFIGDCRRYAQLIPIAGYKPIERERIGSDLDQLKALGYRGIKLHPRFSQLDLASATMVEAFNAAAERDLVIFYCTYQHCSLERWPDVDPLLALVRILKAAPTVRVVLVHGGDVELLRYMQLARFNDNLLLDLSQTIAKYPGSSIDQDIHFLFRHFDRRICIGTDWPQHSCVEVRERFEQFSAGVEEAKCHNIAWRNLLTFLRLDPASYIG